MKHILLIEDNDELRENTAEILDLSNYKVTTAENGKIGIQKALEDKPDLIICDVMMPVLDGYGVLHLINKNPELVGIPFIFLTAKSERGDFRKGMEMGADDYITKPFSDIELLNAVEGRLKRSELLKKNYSPDEKGLNTFLNDVKGGVASLHDLAESSNVNSYKKKHIIYQEGNYPNKLFFIKKGKVKTFKSNDIGKELTIDLFNEGDFFGYTALLENSKYRETAEALEDCELCIISKEDFEMLINNREVAQKFIGLLAKNISEKEEQLLGLAYNSLRKRVADALLTLQQKYRSGDNEKFSMQISREDLANIAGTATESLIRTLSDFKAEKLVEIKDGNIVILNEKKLSSMIN
jgi:CRP-like cAMP-binding protein/DNA-binding NarL/FixJ family response regulator